MFFYDRLKFSEGKDLLLLEFKKVIAAANKEVSVMVLNFVNISGR